MKLLFISLNDHVPWGGSEELWSKTALYLSGNHQITVLVKRWKETHPKLKKLIDADVNVKFKDQYQTKKSFIDKFYRKFFGKTRTKNIKFNYQPYNHVLISLGNNFDSNLNFYTNTLIEEQKDYSLIIQLATDLRHITDKQIQAFVESYQKAKNVFFLSEDNVFKTELLLGVELTNKIKINNPFNFSQGYIAPKSNKFNMACVAAFTSFHKGQDLLITALGQEKWRNRDFKLNLYGDGINKQQIKRLIERYNLDSKVIIKGFVKNKEDIWKENTICIMPSRMEGQSLAMLEAMSFGRMVIATNVGDANELIIEDETGFLIPAATVELIDEALEKAWLARNEITKMGINSRKHLFNYITKDPIIQFAEQIEKSI